MAANTLASIAAATAAGYKLERTTLVNASFKALLGKWVTGIEGQAGRYVEFVGESTVTATADANALANLNKWRDNRYGADSTAVSLSSAPNAGLNLGSTAPTHRSMTKDSH